MDPRGGLDGNSPPRSLLILPLLAILSMTCLVFSEIEYLLPIARLLQKSDENLPSRSNRFDGLWRMPTPLAKKNTVGALLMEEHVTEILEQDTTKEETTKKPAFDRIVLLGERHSGTSYTTRMLGECFPDLGRVGLFGEVQTLVSTIARICRRRGPYALLQDKTAANDARGHAQDSRRLAETGCSGRTKDGIQQNARDCHVSQCL